MTDTGATGYALAIRGNAVAYAGSYYENLGQMCFSPPTPAMCVTETVGASFVWNAFTPVRAWGYVCVRIPTKSRYRVGVEKKTEAAAVGA